MIEVSGLTERYGDRLAADDLSSTVRDGSVTGFPRAERRGHVDGDAPGARPGLRGRDGDVDGRPAGAARARAGPRRRPLPALRRGQPRDASISRIDPEVPAASRNDLGPLAGGLTLALVVAALVAVALVLVLRRDA